MPTQLPFVSEVFNYRVTTLIDGTEYIFDVRWNERDSAWYFDISDAEGSLILAGTKIMLGSPLGRRSVDPRYPNGIFSASDLSGADEDATYTDLGTRVVVFFYAASELVA